MRRRHAIVLGISMLVAIAAAALPASASAVVNHDPCGFENRMPTIYQPGVFERPAYHSDCPQYKGWGHTSLRTAGSCLWSGCKILEQNGPVLAYAWKDGAWVRHDLPNGDWVYAYPYAGSWSWAYHWDTKAWYAMHSDQITIYATSVAY